MTISITPSEVRIEHTVQDQVALFKSFLWFYIALVGAGIIVAAFLNPEIILGVLFFAGFLAWWAMRIRRSQESAVPWVVMLTPHELRHTWEGGDTLVNRAQVSKAIVRERSAGRTRVHVLEVRDHDDQPLLMVSLPDADSATAIEAGLEEWDWGTAAPA